MSRISIDVTPDQHQRLKALAALQGMSIKEFVLARTLGQRASEAEAIDELRAMLDDRLHEAESKGPSPRTVEDIFRQALDEAGQAPG